MWDFRRKGWTFRSGGDGADAPSGSGLFKSTDGGATWTELDATRARRAFPPKPWGRIAVAVAPVEAERRLRLRRGGRPEERALPLRRRRRDLAGRWTAARCMVWRPFYFAQPDRRSEGRRTRSSSRTSRSSPRPTAARASPTSAAARTATSTTCGSIPTNTDHVIAGDDGGLWYSYDGGNQWWKARQPADLAVLPRERRHGPAVSRLRRPAGQQLLGRRLGVSRRHRQRAWENMYGGDGFWMFADPPIRLHLRRSAGRRHRPRQPQDARDRATSSRCRATRREAALQLEHADPHEPDAEGRVYIGAQFLFRSRDHGQTLGAHLARPHDERSGEAEAGGVRRRHRRQLRGGDAHARSTRSPSRRRTPNVIWVGTDDGNVQVTRDGGKTWTNVVGNVAGPAEERVGLLDRGRPLRRGHRLRHLRSPHLRRHEAVRLQDDGLRQDLDGRSSPPDGAREGLRARRQGGPGRSANLLFVGTEFGLWISLDGGRQWAQYKGGDFPAVAVRDLVVQPRDGVLVLATHGRGIWIIDDITPLRALTRGHARAGSRVPARPAGGPAHPRRPAAGARATRRSTAPNPPGGALITYYQKKRHIFGELKIEVLGPDGKLLDTLPASKRRGLTRAAGRCA